MPPDFFADKGVVFVDHTVFPLFVGFVQGDDALGGSADAPIEGSLSESATSVAISLAKAFDVPADYALIALDSRGVELGRDVLHLGTGPASFGYFSLSVSGFTGARSFAVSTTTSAFGISTLSYETCSSS
jgi:hypothetical protein